MPNKQSVATDTYNDHLYPNNRFRRNSTNNRLALLERLYSRLLGELAMNRFKWTGLPENIDVRFLELKLYMNARAVFFHDRNLDAFLVMGGSGNGRVNYQDQPTTWLVVGTGYPSKTLKADQVVPIYANYLRSPDLDIVWIYASKLAEIDLTIEINMKSARRNKILAVPENQRLSAVNLNRQLDEGAASIQVSPALMDQAVIQAYDLGVDPLSIVNLHILRTRLWNECMGLLGIENANQDKKERLVASEVDANQDQTSMMRYVNLNERRRAAEEINKRFGEIAGNFVNGAEPFKVEVEYWTDVERMAELPAVGFMGPETTNAINEEGRP